MPPSKTQFPQQRRDAQTQSIHDLARLLPLWPFEITDTSVEARKKRIALLHRALRAERGRGLAGHWTYDLARHCALLRCYQSEVAQLAALGLAPVAGAKRAASRSAG